MAYSELDLIHDYMTKENHVREARRAPEVIKIDEQNVSMSDRIHEIAATWSMKRKLQSELIAMTNTIAIGSINKTPEALRNAKVGIARAKIASDVLDYADKYQTYEIIIKGTTDKNFDSLGLPKDPVRVFIASQKAILRNNISSELCNPSERELFKARIDNLNAFEKDYKLIQKKYMDLFIKNNPDHPSSDIYLKKNPHLKRNQQKSSELER